MLKLKFWSEQKFLRIQNPTTFILTRGLCSKINLGELSRGQMLFDRDLKRKTCWNLKMDRRLMEACMHLHNSRNLVRNLPIPLSLLVTLKKNEVETKKSLHLQRLSAQASAPPPLRSAPAPQASQMILALGSPITRSATIGARLRNQMTP
jgi:hypothetical protein